MDIFLPSENCRTKSPSKFYTILREIIGPVRKNGLFLSLNSESFPRRRLGFFCRAASFFVEKGALK